jgi:hypothetical protein
MREMVSSLIEAFNEKGEKGFELSYRLSVPSD